MRISAKAEYACIAMLELAAHHGDSQPVRIKTIADTHQIPQRFLVQILLQLKGAGLVASIRGASGGYQLTRPPEKMSLADVIDVIDRTPAPRARAAAGTSSPVVLAVRSIWTELQMREHRFLSELTLADLVQRAQQPSAPSYQI